MLLQLDAPEFNKEAEDEDDYDFDFDFGDKFAFNFHWNWNSSAYIWRWKNKNLFNNYIYNNDQNESLHSRLINDLRSADPDNNLNEQFIRNNKPTKRRHIVYDEEE